MRSFSTETHLGGEGDVHAGDPPLEPAAGGHRDQPAGGAPRRHGGHVHRLAPDRHPGALHGDHTSLHHSEPGGRPASQRRARSSNTALGRRCIWGTSGATSTRASRTRSTVAASPRLTRSHGHPSLPAAAHHGLGGAAAAAGGGDARDGGDAALSDAGGR